MSFYSYSYFPIVFIKSLIFAIKKWGYKMPVKVSFRFYITHLYKHKIDYWIYLHVNSENTDAVSRYKVYANDFKAHLFQNLSEEGFIMLLICNKLLIFFKSKEDFLLKHPTKRHF